MTKCHAVQTFAVSPVVIRCSCDAKVVVRKDGDWRRHLAGENPGEFHPWPQEG